MATNIKVTASNMSDYVRDVFMYCHFINGEDEANYVRVDGIVYAFELNLKRLEHKRQLVLAMIDELPKQFRRGYSFLNMCLTKDGNQWTADRGVCEKLVAIAMALGLMSYTMPREKWYMLPGGLPYLTVK